MIDTRPFNGKYHRASEVGDGGVLLLEFNRMWAELQTIVERISASGEVRAVVLSSSIQRTFTAGLDLNAQSELSAPALDPARKALQLRDHLLEFQAAISSLEKCRQPIICAMYGTSVGLAIDIASACDVRLAASDAVFGIFEVNVGLAADIGTLQRFPKIVGNDSKARELALTGRTFSPAEARDIGFVSEVVSGGRGEVVAAAVDLAKVIAQKSPIAVVSTKHLMNHARDHSVEEGLLYTAAWNASMLQSMDTPAAMKGVISKRLPKFAPLNEGSVKAKL